MNEMVIEQQQPKINAVTIQLGALRANSAQELICSAKAIATPLADLIKTQKLYTTLQGRNYVHVEGWTTLAMMLGMIVREHSVEEKDGIYIATMELVRISGTENMIMSRASAECGSTDEKDRYGKPIWANRPSYAKRSMAITRATGKVCRISLSWIMTLAGYEPTPAEEMGHRENEVEPRIGAASSNHKHIEARIVELGLPRERVRNYCQQRWGVEHFPDLTQIQYRDLLSKLPDFAIRVAKEKQPEEIDQDDLVDDSYVSSGEQRENGD